MTLYMVYCVYSCMLTIVDVIQLQCLPRFSLSSGSMARAGCYLDADGDRKLDMQVIEITQSEFMNVLKNNIVHYALNYISLRTLVLAAACQTLIIPSSGLKHHIIQLLSCLAPSFTQVSQTPMCKGNVFQMTPGSQQTSAHAPSRTPQEIPSTFSQLTRH